MFLLSRRPCTVASFTLQHDACKLQNHFSLFSDVMRHKYMAITEYVVKDDSCHTATMTTVLRFNEKI